MTGLIEPGFMFSQHGLNTFARCPRRFLLKYIDRQPWPVPEQDDPDAYQQHLTRGRILHEWLARAALGIDVAPIVAGCGDALLQTWWQAASQVDLQLPAMIQEAELPLVVPLGDHRLYARFDLVALDPGGDAVIVDWKTLQTRPSPRVLRTRIQTLVYLYVLVAAGHVISGGAPVDPARTTMIYWFANIPDEPELIAYSRQGWERDRQSLLDLVARIVATPREGFVTCENERECSMCNYRTLCHGSRLADLPPMQSSWIDEDLDELLDLTQIPEELY